MAEVVFESISGSQDRPRSREEIAAYVREATPEATEMAIRANPAWGVVSPDGYLEVEPTVYQALAISYGTRLTDLLNAS